MGTSLSRNKKEKPAEHCSHQQTQQYPGILAKTSTALKATEQNALDPAIPMPENSNKVRCTTCRQEQLAARKYRIRLVIGLFLPFALQALDVTIIASALPWIASDFDNLSQMNWIISAFNLCSATFIPFWGQMADIFGRTAAMEMALLMMIIGSALCTAAPVDAFQLLIFGRAIQGLSVAGISVVTRTILADKVSLKENAKNTSLFTFFGGMAYGLGPVMGGYLTNVSWRWCFAVNIPVAVAAAILIMFLVRPVLLGAQPLPEHFGNVQGGHESNPDGLLRRFKARMSTIDYGGQFLFLFGMGLLILALTWGGATYSWNEAQVIVPLILGCLLLCGFVWWEYLMVPGRFVARKFPLQQPTIPWELLAQRNMSLLVYINFATGMAMIAVLYFVDIYFSLVQAYSPSDAGLRLLYYTPGIGLGVYAAMYMCNVYPRQTFAPLLLGSIIEATGISVLAYALSRGQVRTIYAMMALTGAGTGLRFMPGSLHGIGFFPNKIASVIALTSFAIPLGGTLAMTIMDTVFNNKAGFNSSTAMSSSTSSANSTSGSTLSNFIDFIALLPPDEQAAIRNTAKDGIVWAFIAILPCMWLCVVAAAFLGNVKITIKSKVDESGGMDFSENVTENSFLMAVFRRHFRVKTARKEQPEVPGEEKNPGQVVVTKEESKGDVEVAV